MSAAWPLVKRRIVEMLPTLPGWSGVQVSNGQRLTAEDPPAFATVGYVEGEDNAGSYEQTRNGDGWQGALEESGTVLTEVVCWTGDTDMPALETRAFDLVDAWEAAVSADETLGVLPAASTASLAVDVRPEQNQNGAVQRLVVSLSYFARGL